MIYIISQSISLNPDFSSATLSIMVLSTGIGDIFTSSDVLPESSSEGTEYKQIYDLLIKMENVNRRFSFTFPSLISFRNNKEEDQRHSIGKIRMKDGKVNDGPWVNWRQHKEESISSISVILNK